MKKGVLLAVAAAVVLAACAVPDPQPIFTNTERDTLQLEDDKLYVALVWHQHQPVYFKDPETGVYEKPWVRLHAAKDYLDMVTILEDYPNVQATYNITPSLIEQLNDLGAGAKDLYWVHTEIPADDLTRDEKRFILERFFDINPGIVARFPRYQELADSRADLGVDRAITAWEEEDFLDLQVLFNLAWTDPDWLAEEPLAALVEQGEGFAESDKQIVLDEHVRLINETLPYHAERQEAGQIEITTTPYAHPILPLLIDTQLAAVALPDAELPPRFSYGQDAITHLERGIALYEETFGAAPRGMWPAEGSVAESIVVPFANAGIQWIATDEEVLANSLPDFDGFTRDADDTVQQADVLYRPYLVQGTRGEPVAVVFRDKTISDKIGFEYSGTPGDEAAADLMARLMNIKEQLEADGAEGPHLVTVLLDGENAWEFYENDGKEFLHEMYRLLNESETIVTVTPSAYLDALEAAGEPIETIDDLYPGSWIDGTYSTWIGEEEENLAWLYLLRARQDLQTAIDEGDLDDDTIAQAFDLMYAAQGSDWFWWYGSDQNSGSDGDFDAQFRRYLEAMYRTIGEPVPSYVYIPVIPQVAQQPDQQPLDLLSVSVDGFGAEDEWSNAGLYNTTAQNIDAFYYGFDAETIYLRVEGEFDAETTLGFYMNLPEGGSVNAYSRFGENDTLFGFGAQRVLEVTFQGGFPSTQIYTADGQGGWEAFSNPDALPVRAALGGTTLEIGAPLVAFSPGIRSGDRINLRMVVTQGEEDVAVVPQEGPALAVSPDLPIPNVFLEVEDPAGDDYGPGSYTYATDQVFSAGSFDLTRFTAGFDDETIFFRAAFDGPVENVWGSPNGLSIQTIDIYIDTDGPESGQRMLLPGRGAALTEDFGWDYAIWVEGWEPGIYAPGPDGPVELTNTFSVVTNPGQQRVTISVPRSSLEGDPTTWSFAVVVGGQEGFPSAGVWRLRDVEAQASQYRFGGSPGGTNATRLMDILVPAGLDITQEELLTVEPSSQDVGDLEADDLPQVLMISPE
ncbi:MAG: glycoside hydrolase [Chloroflexi bacterium]|nr:glycoside hydrolase [Chloroflexota bacterium]